MKKMMFAALSFLLASTALAIDERDPPIFQAISKGDLEGVRAIIEGNPDSIYEKWCGRWDTIEDVRINRPDVPNYDKIRELIIDTDRRRRELQTPGWDAVKDVGIDEPDVSNQDKIGKLIRGTDRRLRGVQPPGFTIKKRR